MTTRIGIISDIHATPGPVAEAMKIFKQQGVSHILCAGDVAGYGNQLDETIEILTANGCRTVMGNHDAWYLEDSSDQSHPVAGFFSGLSAVLELSIETELIYMVHASPPDSMMEGIKLLDQDGQMLSTERECWQEKLAGFGPDVLIVGHTHQVYAERLADTLLINPGSTCFNHCCAVLELPSLDVQFFALSGKPIQKSWNWGMYARGG